MHTLQICFYPFVNFEVEKEKKYIYFIISDWILNQIIHELIFLIPGSLPPSPADSGVSDVDSSSSGNGQPICSDEIKARLGLSGTTAIPNNSGQQNQLPPPPAGTFLHPNFYQTAPLRNLWNNRNVSCELHFNDVCLIVNICFISILWYFILISTIFYTILHQVD